MNKFPKKYNYQNTKLTKENQKKGKYIDSTLFPGDQKLHPGCIFSLYYQDLFKEICLLQNKNFSSNIFFWLSSNFYSKLNNPNINLKHLESQIVSQLKQNKKFINKLWLWSKTWWDVFVYSEQFNRYIRKVFVDLYNKWSIALKKETVYRSKEYQTNLFKNNINSSQKNLTEYSLKYFIDSKWHAVTVPTTSLETIFADVWVAVNPQDKRYKKLIWQSVIIPITNKIIPIIWDESVDSFKGSWVFRITPGHDQYWLELAKKHGLPTNIYAIDVYGKFTKHAWEFAWKTVEDFFDNIVKYVDDIGNLESKKKLLVDQNFDIRTWEKLDSISLDQRSIGYSYSLDYLLQQFSDQKISCLPLDAKEEIISLLEDKKSVNISNKSTKWVLIPIVNSYKWGTFPINDDIVLERYKASKTKRKLTLTLIILNLILDNHLSCSFSVEELVESLFYTDSSWEKTKIEKYLEIYRLESQSKKEYKKWLKDIEKLVWKLKKDTENIKIIIDLLKDSFAIKFDWDNIYLDFSSLFAKRDTLELQKEDSFNKSFIDSVRFLYKNNLSKNIWSYENIKNKDGLFFSWQDEKDFVTNTMLLSLEYSKNLLFSSLFFHPTLVDINQKKIVNNNSRFLIKDFGENLSIYWPDVMRLVLLLWEDQWNKTKFDTYKAQQYSDLLNKIWNAYRYVYKKHVEWKKEVNIKRLTKKIKSNITNYDLRIIHDIKTLIDDFEYQVWENKILPLWKKVLNFLKDNLCDKYLESTKLYSDENTWDVVILSFVILLKLAKPYIPFFINHLESIFNVNWDDYNVFEFKDYELKEKNYKINLLMDIVDKLKNLKLKIWLKKHQYVDIFVQANPDFLDFLMQGEELLRSLINIRNIECVRLHEDLPSSYHTDNVININLWAKRVLEQVEVKKDILQELKEEYENKKEHIQHLKSLIASISQSGNEVALSQKRKEIESLQKEIDDLDFEISKLKAK